jgi:hypothetical protein
MRLIGLVVLLALVFLLLRIFKGGGGGLATRVCPHCSQQIPVFGAYCPICGARIV